MRKEKEIKEIKETKIKKQTKTKTTKVIVKEQNKKQDDNNNNDNDNNNNNKIVSSNNPPLMRKATAIWLLENTSLTFKQIADFCNIHPLEIQGIADGDVAVGVAPMNPIDNNQLTREMIEQCEEDSNKKLELKKVIADDIVLTKKGRKNNTYVPMAKRGDKPDGIAYLLKFYPDITDKQIRSLINTTTPMIRSIREKTRWDIKDIRPRDPVMLGLCSQTQFNAVVGEKKK